MDAVRRWIEESPYTAALGVQLSELSEENAQLALPYADQNSNPGKALHGGVAASLSAIGAQAVTRAALGPDAGPFHTAALQVNYLSAAIGEPVVAEARLLRRGKALCFVEVDVATAAGKPIAHATSAVRARFAPTTSTHGKRPATPAADAPTGEEEIDLSFVDDLVARFGGNREAAIPILQAIQVHYRYLPDEALQRVCELTEITPAQIAGTSSFYSQFRRSPGGAPRGAGVSRHRLPRGRARTRSPRSCGATWRSPPTRTLTQQSPVHPRQAVACVGCCSLAPVMMIEEETAGRLTPASARQALDSLVPPT